jgi:DNA-binding NarL/FixJ family response regulator
MIRVVIADDQALVRSGLRMILEAEDDVVVVGEAANGAEAVDLIQSTAPDVALIDIRMPVMDGIETTRHLAARGAATRVLVLTMYGADRNVHAALKAGAAGFLLKTDPPDQLVTGVRVVAAGQALLAPDVTRRLVERFIAEAPPLPSADRDLGPLSVREDEVLRLIATGLSNAEIAAALHVTRGTVKTHVTHILTKLGLRDRVQAVVFAFEHGLARRRSTADRSPQGADVPRRLSTRRHDDLSGG